MKTRNILLKLALLCIAGSCAKKPESLKANDYAKWISVAEHGFVKEKKVGAILMTVRFLPADYLAYREFVESSNDSVSFDSLYNSYRCGMTFHFFLSAPKDDVTYANLKYFGEFSEQAMMDRNRALSFSSGVFFTIKHKGIDYKPVINIFEADDLDNKLRFTLAFQIPEFDCSSPGPQFEDIDFLFEGGTWEVGVNHFLFSRSVFTDKPKMIF
jgi:hypothetical protein